MQAVDISPLRRVNQAIFLLTTGAREAAFRNVKTIAECLARAPSAFGPSPIPLPAGPDQALLPGPSRPGVFRSSSSSIDFLRRHEEIYCVMSCLIRLRDQMKVKESTKATVPALFFQHTAAALCPLLNDSLSREPLSISAVLTCHLCEGPILNSLSPWVLISISEFQYPNVTHVFIF